MKNIFSKTTENRTQNGVKSYSFPTRLLSPILIFAFLTLGFGQVWADNGDFYNMYIAYSFEGAGGAINGNDNNTGVTVDAGTLTSGSLTLTGVYLKCWDDWDKNYKSSGGQLCYTNKGGSTQYISCTRSEKSGNNYEYQNSNPNVILASYDQASGSFEFHCWGQTWGWGDRYFPKSSGHYVLKYKIAPPAVSGFGVTPSGHLAGSGTEGEPYLVASGSNLTLTASGSQAHTDANSSINYKFGDDAYSTTATKNITVTSSGSIAVKARCKNTSASLDGAETETITIYYAPVSVKDISVYIYVGGCTPAQINSIELFGTPCVGSVAQAAVHKFIGDFTTDDDWRKYTFTNVSEVRNVVVAREGGRAVDNITITDDIYYKFDGTNLGGKCVPPANPTWGTAPANGVIGGSMTATVSGAPADATITWTSTNESAATVSGSGVISYRAVGNTTIKANVSWSASGDYCASSYELSQVISVTSGATVTATRTCPAYVSTGAGEVALDITSTGASSGWYYRIKNKSTGGYYAPDNQSAASNALSWTMTGGIGAELTTLVVELYNGSNTLICTSSDVTVTGEVAHITYIAAGSNGSVSPKTIYANNSHVHPSITATPNSHYHFKNWTSNNAAASVASTTNATTTVTATAGGYTITANFEGDQYTITYKDQGGSEFSGTQTSAPTTHTYGTTTTLKIPTKTGYTFNGWFTVQDCSSGQVGTASAASLSATGYTSNITLYAKWTEIMSDLSTSCHYDVGNPGYAIPTKTVSSIGISTTANLSATAPGTGYTFVGWTLTHCVRTSGEANSRNITVRSDGSGEAASAVANYTEDLSTTWYIVGATGTNYPFTGWGTSGIRMSKKTGHSTEEIYYCNIIVNRVASGNEYEFQTYNHANTTYYGYNDKDIDKEHNSTTVYSGNPNNMRFKPYVTGTYEFKLDNTGANPVLTVTWPVFNQVRISVASPTDATNTGNFDLSDPVSNVRTVTRSLKANTTYTFKIMYNSDWYGYNSGTFTRNSSTSSNSRTLSTSGGNLTLTTDYAGDYTFRFNQSTKALSVDFPTAYKVTYGKGTVDGSSSSCSAKDIDNGNAAVTSNSTWVKSGNRVVLTAPVAKTGYTYNGWFDNNSGTGAAITTSANCTITVTSALTRYACYTINNHAITHSASTHGSYTIQVGSAATVSTSTTSDYGKTIKLAATPATGYHFGSWSAYKTGTPATTVTVTSNQFTMPDYAVTVGATFTPNTYTVSYNANGGSGTTTSSSHTYDVSKALTTNGYSKTGYNFGGWATSKANADAGTVGYTNGQSVINLVSTQGATVELWAIWNAKQCTINFDFDATDPGHGSHASATTSTTATYAAAMPSVTPPTAAQGYAFMGYYDAADGAGTQYYDGTGVSVTNWDKDTESPTTLYAYFKKAEITAITLDNTMFDPVAAGGTGFVIANPTIEPTPVLPVKICWELLYDNDNPVPAGHEAIDDHDGSHPNRVKFSIAGLAAGGYKIKATLRTGDDCSGGTLLSEREVSFTIASGYTVTIQYKDSEGNTIAPSTTSPGKATDWTSISAPTIVGYNFSTWVPGDGITLESSATTNSNRFKATFKGTLTARYTKKRVIYFNNTLGWSNVYVYFYSGEYWDGNKGTGSQTGGTYTGKHGRMQPVSEGSKIYYFDAEGASVNASYTYVAFTELEQTDYQYFAQTKSVKNKVAYRGDYNSTKLPMFVPLADQTPVSKNTNLADYYNEGYWMNYPENTGYALRLFNSSGVEIDSIPFEFTPDKTMPMSVEYILDGSKTYQFKLYRTDGKWFGNNGTMKAGASGDIGETSWEFKEKDGETTRNNCQIKTNAAGTYTFTLDFGYKGGYNYLIGVHYPAAANDFQILYNDNAEWSLGSAHDANWVHPSRIIRARENGVDTISFFVAKDNTPILKARKVSSINPSTGAITWGSLNINGAATQSLSVDSSAVYNFKVTQGAAGVITSIEKIGAYTGNYYIRSSALSNKWGNYVDNLDHRMTYSSFSESNANSFGEKYSHYKAKWCPRNTNIAFCIANDYSPCITDTLKQDVGNPYDNTDINGTLNNDGVAGHSGNNAYLDPYSANVRFMWNRKTNKISRAYVSASTSTNAKFLVLQGSGAANANIYDGSTGAAFAADPPGANSVILSDKENWIYEVTVKANPSALVKLYANYCGQTQWFRGAAGGFAEGTTAIQILGGSASASQYSVRVIYDFKTNRLVCAWVPSGSSETIDTDITVNADVMIVREHQESAQCITFSNNAKMTSVKNVYGVMRFNRWILNNRQHPEDQNKDHARADHIAEDLAEHHPPLSVGQQKSTYERRLYFISFPFDVLVGDIFGFGTYGQYWVIQYYDGLNRAKNGYWMDSKPNWKYVSPTEVAQGYKLEKNQGYILELNLSAMAADNTTFWSNGISTIELYFPSTVHQNALTQTNCNIPALSDEYECKINRGTEEGDRRVKDSYWRCIGVPSYNLYNSTLKDGSGNDISWKTDYTWYNDEREFPFIYMWNKTDNTLTPQATSTFTFQPMHSYLTQIKSAIVWTAVSAKPSSIVARRARKEATKEYNWRIELKQDTTFLDQTYVRMTDLEQVTDNFDFGQDLIKELNSRSNIYTFIGYEKVAANSMTLHTDQTTVIPVGANITTEGEYTFALPDGADGIGVTLIDEETGVRTNLSAGMDYTVNLEKGTHDNRFWLEISPVQQTPTDIELINGENGDASLNGVRKVLIDGILYIVKDGKLFDARGARVQ